MLFQLHLDTDIVQKATGPTREELEQLQAEAKGSGDPIEAYFRRKQGN